MEANTVYLVARCVPPFTGAAFASGASMQRHVSGHETLRDG